MIYEHVLGASLKIYSHNATAPGARAEGAKPAHLLIIAHGLYIEDVGAGALSTGTTALPQTFEVRFSVEHGKQADNDDLNYCLKELAAHGIKNVDRLWPDKADGATITNYAMGKGIPKPKTLDVSKWFRGEDAIGQKGKASPEWADKSFVEPLIAKMPADMIDIGRVRKSCTSIADVFVAMTAPHRYTHLLFHVCRELIMVKT